jgi:hypothetical protein
MEDQTLDFPSVHPPASTLFERFKSRENFHQDDPLLLAGNLPTVGVTNEPESHLSKLTGTGAEGRIESPNILVDPAEGLVEIPIAQAGPESYSLKTILQMKGR